MAMIARTVSNSIIEKPPLRRKTTECGGLLAIEDNLLFIADQIWLAAWLGVASPMSL
jgi:hypothetical protein